MNIFRRARFLYLLHRHAIPHRLWENVIAKLAILQGLTAVEKAHLRELCTLFLHEKRFIAAQGLQLNAAMKLEITVQACLPVLKLGLDLLSEWSSLIVYPDTFLVEREVFDSIGIVHRQQQTLSGEAWERGPLIISWSAVEEDRLHPRRGHNVIIHEIAHKLDMLDGYANGMPPLHYRMQGALWTEALNHAYQHLNQRLEHHQRSCLSPYAATSPAEFFAVISEYFFSAPDILHAHFSDVYRQLSLYYRQDPVQRLFKQ